MHWTGYQDERLPELWAAMDVALFAAPGSDHGHRAISEAQACARPVVARDIAGVADLIDDDLVGSGDLSEPCKQAKCWHRRTG